MCEKPLAPSAAEADALMARARACGTFLAESMWTRAFPAARALRAALEAGAIGDVVAATVRTMRDEAARDGGDGAEEVTTADVVLRALARS